MAACRLQRKNNPILGLFTGAGLLAVFAIGDIRKSKYYKTYRLSWINSDNKLISQDYEKHIFLKIPLNDLEDKITFGKNKIYISYNGKKIVLTRKPSSLKLQKALMLNLLV